MENNKAHRSPLFYVGDKYKLFPSISKHFPSKINRFIEPFTGGGSVFLNSTANEYHINDIDSNVIKLHNFLLKSATSPVKFFKSIKSYILKYKLSHSYINDIIPPSLRKEYKKTYYAKFNKSAFNTLKHDYNKSSRKDPLKLYFLLIFGFNRMLRFNSSGNYNLPVGNVDFNKNVKSALDYYFQFASVNSIKTYNLDFLDFIKSFDFSQNDFVYLDPPYLITFSEYNKLWDDVNESRLLFLLDYLNSINVKFAISNVTHYKGKVNLQFLNWSKKYYSHSIKSNYISYHDNSKKSFNEVLITNYPTKSSISKLNLSNELAKA